MITSLEPLTIKDYYAEEAESLFASVRALLGDTKRCTTPSALPPRRS